MNSLLNPEAPEFHPHLSSVTQDGYSTVNKTIRSSNHMPTGASYDLFKTYTDFNIVTCHLSENVIVQSNQIMITELPAVKLKCNDIEYNTDKIIDANDSVLDRVNINIDTVSGVNKPDEAFMNGLNKVNIASWNRQKPIIAKIQVGSTTFLGAKNIPRPQLMFKDTIDNSACLWVPKISDKPNNIKPLALNILYDDEGEAVGYEHPYQLELDLYHPPSQCIEPDPAPPTFPASLEETRVTFVETEAQVDDLVSHLLGVDEIAVDVEHHSYRTYQGITCLMQITTDEGGEFIIDALAAREHIHKLNLVFTDPKKVKVFHGAEMDVMWLQRDFGVYIVGLFDTYQAAKALKLSGLSLKYLLMKYCGVNADKKYQLADWRMRPLPDELVEYARMDTHYLLYIWRRMKAELLEAGQGQPTLLLSAFEQSRQICGKTYKKEVVDDSSHMRLYVRSKKSFNSRQMAALQLLYKWRDAQARELDESTIRPTNTTATRGRSARAPERVGQFACSSGALPSSRVPPTLCCSVDDVFVGRLYLLPNHMLLMLAETLPREVQGVNACCNPTPPFVKQHLITIHRMILSCRELPLEPQLYQMPHSIRNMQNSGHPSLTSYNVHDYSHLPEYREDQQINLDRAAVFLDQRAEFKTDIPAFQPQYKTSKRVIVSDLNAEAKMFIPPYDRYRKYRSLAQLEELQEFKDKEAKIAAISKGNELIKREVLIKIQQAKSNVEKEESTPKEAETEEKSTETKPEKGSGEKRKRKITSDRNKDSVAEIAAKIEPKLNTAKIERNKSFKPFIYKNANYKKFYDDTDKVHKQPKMKFKKHK